MSSREPYAPGPEAMKFAGWQRLNAEYAKQFGVESPAWASDAPKS